MGIEKVGNVKYKRSKFLHLLKRGDGSLTYCLYHGLSKRKVYGGEILKSIYDNLTEEQPLPNLISHIDSNYSKETVKQIINDLISMGLIIEEENDDLKTYLNYLNGGLQLYSIRHTYFIPAGDCNLRCEYCFVEDENRGEPTGIMTIETARKGLEVFAKLTEQAEKISLTFYGGEPLLNADIVYWSMRYIRVLESQGKFKQPVDVSLLTNGTLVNQETVDALIETKSNVSVSIDGPRYLHDLARKKKNRSGSFNRAIRGYKLLQEAGLRPGISCTLSRYNIEHMDEIVDVIVNELRPPGMGFNILLPTISSGNPLDIDHSFATDQLIFAFKKLRDYGIYEDRVMRRVLPFRDDFFHFKDCMGVGGQIVITPEGRIGPCQAFQFVPGYFPLNVDILYDNLSNINSEMLYQDPLFDTWRHRFPLNMEECVNCYAISVCGGGCPYAAQVNHGSIWKIDERICFQAKKILDWMIWETYDQMMMDKFSSSNINLSMS